MVQEASKNALLGVHEAITNAVVEKRPDELRGLLSKGFRTEGGDYNFDSGAALVQAVESGAVDFTAISNDVADVQFLSDDAAVVIGRRQLRGSVRGEEFQAEFPIKAVYTRENEKWKAALWAVGRPEQERALFTA